MLLIANSLNLNSANNHKKISNISMIANIYEFPKSQVTNILVGGFDLSEPDR